MRSGQEDATMRIEDLRNRINKLTTKFVAEEEPWPPTKDDWLCKLLYDANVEMGLKMPIERPEGGIIFFLLEQGATRFFDLHPIEADPLDETRLKK